MDKIKAESGVQVIRWYGRWDTLFNHGIPRRWARFLQRWISKQRWFMSKSDDTFNLKLDTGIPVEIENRLVWWLFIQTTSDASRMQYQLPIVLLQHAGTLPVLGRLSGVIQGDLVDAWNWPPFSHWLLSVMAGHSTCPFLSCWRDQPIQTDLKVTPLPKEQSNSSVMLGENYFLKGIRCITSGVQPEEEMGRELSRRSFRHAIPVLAGVSLATSRVPMSLAVVSLYAPNQGSGWEWLKQQIESQSSTLQGRYDHAQQCWDPTVQSAIVTLCESVKLLGQRTAALHQFLAQPSDHPDFSPEPFGESQCRNLRQRVQERYELTCLLLKRRKHKDRRMSRLLSLLLEQGTRLRALGTISLEDQELASHRIHGDYHLGQVLKTKDDWLIIDFEGEPLRPLEQRRAKDLPWRDVAGMRRSFAYLAAMTSSSKGDESIFHRSLFRHLRDAFMIGYLGNNQAVMPASVQQLLTLYELEKALYEVEYELTSRPDWISIPLYGAVELLGGLVSPEAGIGASKVS